LAVKRATQTKPLTSERIAFEFNLEKELVQLRKTLQSGEYLPGPYKTFTIYDPKQRLISAAPFRDRVVHHCLCNVIEPVFDRTFLPQNYANRKGRGLHKALRAGASIVNRCQYILKGDIQKYFPSIDHQILKEKIARKIKCERTLHLIEVIIDSSNEQEPVVFYFPEDSLFTHFERRKGLPIGNLTSQLFANVYLDSLDHFIVHTLKKKHYARYVDDFIIGGSERRELHKTKDEVRTFLEGLRLRIHEQKTAVFPVRRGLSFLGCRLYPGKILAGKRCGKRFVRRLKQLQRDFKAGLTDLHHIKQVISSYNGHLAHASTAKLRAKILYEHPFVKG